MLGWFRLLVRRRRSRPKRPGQPDTVRSIRLLVLRLARENPALGLPPHPRRTARPGFRTAASNVWEILRQAGIDARFLRSQADALLACDFFETVTLSGVRLYVFISYVESSRGVERTRSPELRRLILTRRPREADILTVSGYLPLPRCCFESGPARWSFGDHRRAAEQTRLIATSQIPQNAGGHRARQPADPDPGCNPSSHCLLGGLGREEPRHGS